MSDEDGQKDEEKISCLARATQLVNDLCDFSDGYFTLKGIENAAFKEQDVIERMEVSCF